MRVLLPILVVMGLLYGTSQMVGWVRFGDGSDFLRDMALLLFWVAGLFIVLVFMKKDIDQGRR